MRYAGQIIKGRFIARPNRFIAHVETPEGVAVCHVKNTGRCRELLVPGAAVYLEKADNPARKTAFSLIAVEKITPRGPLLINMDSMAPNRAFFEAAGRIFPHPAEIKGEVTYFDSRFDFRLMIDGVPHFVEVKGVTLEENGLAMFPDAPTVRGVKHLEGLIRAAENGYGAHVVFVIQMKGVHGFSPNDVTHAAFGDALRKAAKAGVSIHAFDCKVTPGTMEIDEKINIVL